MGLIDKGELSVFGTNESLYSSIQPPQHHDNCVRWGRASSRWYNYPGNASYVDCYPATDFTGVNYDSLNRFRVYLPRCGGCDPNVDVDQVIGYLCCDDGVFVAVSGYLDAAVGTVRMWSLTNGDPPVGWTECISGGTDGRPEPNLHNIAGRMPLGLDISDDNLDSVNAYGGEAIHKHIFLKNDTSPTDGCWQQIRTGNYYQDLLSIEPAETMPPYCVVRFIERYANSQN